MDDEQVEGVVIVEDNRPAGTVTDRDLALTVLKPGHDAGETAAQVIMTEDVITPHTARERRCEQSEQYRSFRAGYPFFGSGTPPTVSDRLGECQFIGCIQIQQAIHGGVPVNRPYRFVSRIPVSIRS